MAQNEGSRFLNFPPVSSSYTLRITTKRNSSLSAPTALNSRHEHVRQEGERALSTRLGFGEPVKCEEDGINNISIQILSLTPSIPTPPSARAELNTLDEFVSTTYRQSPSLYLFIGGNDDSTAYLDDFASTTYVQFPSSST